MGLLWEPERQETRREQIMKSRDEMVVVVATAAHEDWRKQYRAANGDKPRVKKTKDQAFLDRGVTEVDIAARPSPTRSCRATGRARTSSAPSARSTASSPLSGRAARSTRASSSRLPPSSTTSGWSGTAPGRPRTRSFRTRSSRRTRRRRIASSSARPSRPASCSRRFTDSWGRSQKLRPLS